MCFAPKMPAQPAPKQASKSPVLRSGQRPTGDQSQTSGQGSPVGVGRSSTILTSGGGEASAPVAKKTLLGT